MTFDPATLTTTQRAQLTAYRPAAGEHADCRHPGSPPLRLAQSKGLRVVRQCLTCGAVGKTIPYLDVGLTRDEVVAYDMVDPDIALRWAQLRLSRRAAKREQHDEDAAMIHASEWWQWMRAKVLERCKGICEGCLSRPATEVHHKRYNQINGRRVGGEQAYNLVGLCSTCHLPGPEERHIGMPLYHGKGMPAHVPAILAEQRS